MFSLAAEIRGAGEAIVASVRSGEIDLDAAHARADADPHTGRVFAVKVYEAVPGIGKVSTVLLFDVGVYVVVLGTTLLIILTMANPEEEL